MRWFQVGRAKNLQLKLFPRGSKFAESPGACSLYIRASGCSLRFRLFVSSRAVEMSRIEPQNRISGPMRWSKTVGVLDIADESFSRES